MGHDKCYSKKHKPKKKKVRYGEFPKSKKTSSGDEGDPFPPPADPTFEFQGSGAPAFPLPAAAGVGYDDYNDPPGDGTAGGGTYYYDVSVGGLVQAHTGAAGTTAAAIAAYGAGPALGYGTESASTSANTFGFEIRTRPMHIEYNLAFKSSQELEQQHHAQQYRYEAQPYQDHQYQDQQYTVPQDQDQQYQGQKYQYQTGDDYGAAHGGETYDDGCEEYDGGGEEYDDGATYDDGGHYASGSGGDDGYYETWYSC